MPKQTITKTDQLVPDNRNANQHTEYGTLLLEKGILQNKLGRSILISNDNVIIAGNGVTSKAKELGIKNVRVIETTGDEIIAVKRTDISSGTKQFYQMALSDNIIAQENIQMDAEVTNAICSEYEIDDWIDTGEPTTKAKPDNFKIPPYDLIKTDIQAGDVFEIGRHRLVCGDAREPEDWKKLMAGYKADLVITDPPYNVDYSGSDGTQIMNDKMSDEAFYIFLLRAFTAQNENLNEGAAVYVWHADSEGLNFRKAFINSGLLLKQCLIWVKNSLVMGRQDYQWKHEPCLYGWKPGAGHYFTSARTHTTVIEDVVDYSKLTKKELLELVETIMSDQTPSTVLHHNKPSKNDLHPTMKPILLFAQIMENSSKPGDKVADAFGGSGSTMITSEQLGRDCFMMELDPKFCQVIIDRMLSFNTTIKITRNGKKYIPPTK